MSEFQTILLAGLAIGALALYFKKEEKKIVVEQQKEVVRSVQRAVQTQVEQVENLSYPSYQLGKKRGLGSYSKRVPI